jgi:hypothetical protein
MANEENNDNHVATTKLTVKQLGIIAGVLLTILGSFASTFIWIDGRYIDNEVYELHLKAEEKAFEQLDSKTATLIQSIQTQNIQEFNRVYKAIKDGTALPLIVRRDILLTRGETLTANERAELNILETKLDELNIP